MSGFIIFIVGGLLITAALSFYLSTRHQQLVRRELPVGKLRFVSLALIVLSLMLLRMVSGTAASVFILVTVLMLLLTIAPLIIAHRQTTLFITRSSGE